MYNFPHVYPSTPASNTYETNIEINEANDYDGNDVLHHALLNTFSL